jgi:hypothetical protein
MEDNYSDYLLDRIRYFSDMYWKGRIEADMALIAFGELDDLLRAGISGPNDWKV